MKAIGERHGRAKLTRKEALEIKKCRWEKRMKYREITDLYPIVSNSQIWRICNDVNWKEDT